MFYTFFGTIIVFLGAGDRVGDRTEWEYARKKFGVKDVLEYNI